MLKRVCFIIFLVKVFPAWGDQKKIVIENAKTGMVWERVKADDYQVLPWINKESQLWTLEPGSKFGYFAINNVASGLKIICTHNGTEYEMWKLKTHGITRIEAENPKVLQYTRKNTLYCAGFDGTNGNDEWLFIEHSKKLNMKYVIQDNNTGIVLEEVDGILKMEKWKNRDSQLWTLTPQNRSGYAIANVASGNILTYLKDSVEYQTWKLNTRGDTSIQIEHPNVFLAHKNGKPVYVHNRQNDQSDMWFLTDYESKNSKSNSIYIDIYQPKFLIKNKKTGRILDVPQQFVKLGGWEGKSSQLWTLEQQNRSGHFVIRNVANHGLLTYLENGEDHQTWNLDISNNTRIKVEDSNAYLIDRDGEIEFAENRQRDESDKWVLIEEGYESDLKSKPIYAESQALSIQ